MIIQHRYLTFDKKRGLTETLDKLGIKYKEMEKQATPTVGYYSLEFIIYSNETDFKKKQKKVSKFKINPQIGTEYEKADYDNADWFLLHTGEYQYPMPDNDNGYLTSTFNLDDYCSFCGIGKEQNAPFRLKIEPKQKQLQFWGLHWEFGAVFVRESAKNIIEKEMIKGVSFSKPILHKKDTEIDGFFQLHIENILDKGFNNYNTKKITCKFNNEENWNKDKGQDYCGRIKYHHPMIGGYCFDKDIFKTEFDIVETNEYFGSGASANRLQIVSKRFKEIVEKNKLKGAGFTPIVHEKYVSK